MAVHRTGQRVLGLDARRVMLSAEVMAEAQALLQQILREVVSAEGVDETAARDSDD